MSISEKRVFDRFEYQGFNGCECFCHLEILSLEDGRTVVIATELEGNPGTSITNSAEHLASMVCDRFEIHPQKLVWIEHYGYPGGSAGLRERTFDLVTFSRRKAESIHWSPAVLKAKRDGWPGYFQEPNWRPMKDEDWWMLGLPLRSPVTYEC